MTARSDVLVAAANLRARIEGRELVALLDVRPEAVAWKPRPWAAAATASA